MQVRNMKTMTLSLVIALTLVLGGGIALQAAQSGDWMGNSGHAQMGPMPAHEGRRPLRSPDVAEDR